ncbi:DUF368 domain-containing protein [Nocardioides deserti]|uniref:DUF368 domain-containing protein n=1 Tax=Nocardioides deserti TaxID=1588644 RepID=A0ABR6UBG8_9ACTN|nr:DUF368 domain-containing protein [Nocardioides deserti]MBC2961786.1 DUF368 domain-containing protein [Nocardioides deserti]GGO79284.1 DUF368 domain-containing protein [Nocardioides deserti]
MTGAGQGDGGTTVAVRRSPLLLPLDLLRGFLIGMAELVPGVSGGTVALVTGVYDQLIDSASHVLRAGTCLVTGPDRLRTARVELRRTDWLLIAPVLVGMAAAVLTVAGLMESFVSGSPELARGLFLGLVSVSVLVPLRMLPPAHRSRTFDVLAVVGAAVLAYLLVGLAGGGTTADPAPYVVFGAAAVAICALVVPGVSGSFFLLAVGLYGTTLDAVHERDLGYLAVFALGAAVGLGSFVRLLNHLLDHHRRTTLLVMAGLMIGSLRALWPWQSSPADADGEVHGPGALLAPYDPVAGPVLLALVGAAVVAVLILVEARRERRTAM